jgi:hypothetical protein
VYIPWNDEMIIDRKSERFQVAQVLIGAFLTLLATYVSLSVADNVGTPQVVGYVIAPGYVLGMHFASGRGFFDTLGSFMRIALAVNFSYYGLIVFFVMKRVNWPKLSRNPRHHFWMER